MTVPSGPVVVADVRAEHRPTAARGDPRRSRCRSISPRVGRNRYGSSLLVLDAVAPGDDEPVVHRARRVGADRRPDPFGLVLQGQLLAVLEPDPDRLGEGLEDPHGAARRASVCGRGRSCGCWWRPWTSAVDGTADLGAGGGSHEEPPWEVAGAGWSVSRVDGAEGDTQPGGTVAGLVDDLVDGLVGLVGVEQERRSPARVALRPRVGVPVEERLLRLRSAHSAAPVGDLASSSACSTSSPRARRSRTTRSIPATSRQRGVGQRPLGERLAGSPSKSTIFQPRSAVRRVWPRWQVAVDALHVGPAGRAADRGRSTRARAPAVTRPSSGTSATASSRRTRMPASEAATCVGCRARRAERRRPGRRAPRPSRRPAGAPRPRSRRRPRRRAGRPRRTGRATLARSEVPAVAGGAQELLEHRQLRAARRCGHPPAIGTRRRRGPVREPASARAPWIVDVGVVAGGDSRNTLTMSGRARRRRPRRG